jgi:3-methyladenine DNA glycosylase AlkD
MQYDEILKKLKSLSDPKAAEGMARFGINPENTLGISIPNLRKIAKDVGKDHSLAQQLWASGIHEARILASMVDEPEMVTEKQVGNWVKDFDSWDVCDQCCMNLFDKLPFAFEKAIELSKKEEEFEKRAGFALMACLAWHDREAQDEKFAAFFPYIKQQATDERNYVKKAVNWALRQIGKRNANLNKKAIKCAREIQKIDSKSAKWIASDALRELEGEAVQKRLQNK